MEFDLTFFALAIPAVVFAGISKGGFGSGAAFAAAPLLALILEPAIALGVLLPLLMLVDATNLKPYWGKWDVQTSIPIIIGALPGVLLGVWLFQYAKPDAFRVLIGVISVAFVAWQISQRSGWIRPVQRKLGRNVGFLTGMTAGFSSFISHAGGPPVAVFLLSKGFDKTKYQASSVLIFWAINIFKAVPYALIGVFTAQTLLASLYLAPFAVLGAFIGIRAHFWISERGFFALTYVLLSVTGLKLIWDGLT